MALTLNSDQPPELPPTSAAYPLNLRTWAVVGSLALLAGTPATYVKRTADVAPIRSAAYPSDLRSWTTGSKLTTEFYVPPAPPQASLSEPPRSSIYPTELRGTSVGSALALLSGPGTTPPFGRSDPAPPGPPDPLNSRTWLTTLLESPLAGTPANVIFRTSLQAPRWTAPYPVDLRTTTTSLVTTTLAVVGTPFAQYDWPAPNPIAAYPTQLRTHIFYYVQDLNTPPQPPDFPNPRSAAYPLDLRTWAFNAVPVLISTYPFAQHDWPVPPTTVYPTETRKWIPSPSLETILIPTVAPVGDTVTATIPGPPYPINARTIALNLNQSTLAPPPQQPPFGKYIWTPPHTIAPYPIDLRTTIVFKVQDKNTPPQPHDWTVPQAPRYPVDLRSWGYNNILVLSGGHVPGSFTVAYAVNSNAVISPPIDLLQEQPVVIIAVGGFYHLAFYKGAFFVDV